VQFEVANQTKLSYDVKLAQKYWRRTSPKSHNDFSIYRKQHRTLRCETRCRVILISIRIFQTSNIWMLFFERIPALAHLAIRTKRWRQIDYITVMTMF